MKRLISFLKDEEGMAAVEYGLIVAVISLGILLSTQGVMGWINARFTQVAAI